MKRSAPLLALAAVLALLLAPAALAGSGAEAPVLEPSPCAPAGPAPLFTAAVDDVDPEPECLGIVEAGFAGNGADCDNSCARFCSAKGAFVLDATPFWGTCYCKCCIPT